MNIDEVIAICLMIMIPLLIIGIMSFGAIRDRKRMEEEQERIHREWELRREMIHKRHLEKKWGVYLDSDRRTECDE